MQARIFLKLLLYILGGIVDLYLRHEVGHIYPLDPRSHRVDLLQKGYSLPSLE
jgi:hypothetical protein